MSETHLYRHFDEEGTLLYVGISLSALNRLGQHKQNAHWFSKITRVDIETFPSREEAMDAEKRAIAEEKPLHNIKLVSRKKVSVTLSDKALSALEKDIANNEEGMSVKAKVDHIINNIDSWIFMRDIILDIDDMAFGIICDEMERRETELGIVDHSIGSLISEYIKRCDMQTEKRRKKREKIASAVVA